jgi:hypothetical protein
VFAESVDCNLSRAVFVFDQEAWKEMGAKVNELVDYAMQLQAEAVGRLQAGAEPVTARLNVLLYPIPEEPARR